MAATDGEAIDHSNDGLRKRADLLLHVKHVEARHIVLAHITSATLVVHVSTCTEGHVASARKEHNADVSILAAMIECLAHFAHGEGCEGVAIARAIDGDFRDAVIVLKDDFFKG